MEAEDVLADKVDIGGPGACKLRAEVGVGVGAVADRGCVVEEGVEPDVDDLLLIPRERDAPAHARPRHRDVDEALAQEGHHLVVCAHRLDAIGVRLVVRDELLGEGRQLEEPVVLLDLLDRSAVNGAQLLALELTRAGDQVACELELLAADAVRAGVRGCVDVAVLAHDLPEPLHRDGMT